MSRHTDVFDAYQRVRFMRPDAGRWLKPHHPEERKYSPDQPRDDHGRWTVGGSGAGNGLASPMGQINFGDLPNFSDLFGLFQIAPAENADSGIQLAADGKPLFDVDGTPYYSKGGHHELPQSIFRQWDLPSETRRVFDEASTGKLPDGRTDLDGVLKGHYWDEEHRQYNAATRELSERFFKERGIEPNRMTPDQANDLLKEIRESENPKIRDYNRTMRMLRRVFRFRSRGE